LATAQLSVLRAECLSCDHSCYSVTALKATLSNDYNHGKLPTGLNFYSSTVRLLLKPTSLPSCQILHASILNPDACDPKPICPNIPTISHTMSKQLHTYNIFFAIDVL